MTKELKSVRGIVWQGGYQTAATATTHQVLPTLAGTIFTLWSGEAVIYRTLPNVSALFWIQPRPSAQSSFKV